MNERPLLMCGEMVRAILAGRKTQTRRVMKRQPEIRYGFVYGMNCTGSEAFFRKEPHHFSKCHLGGVGTRLWVRETFAIHTAAEGTSCVLYRADREIPEQRWKPSMFMPRWASRLTLEISEVRVERVQEINDEDALAEGMDDAYLVKHGLCSDRRVAYRFLWDDLNKGRGFWWERNPWVWVVTFRQAEATI
jgi:hypothetical protein